MTTSTPFQKILIANRGEIALRVIRTARTLGYQTVAVYSTADAGARHVLEADQAVCIGDPLPAQSYLRIDAIVEAARQTGADAVHPGYGFLAENEDFARACREAGLVFIGPSPEAIIAMGHKAGAKKIMMDDSIQVTATTVRIPTIGGHSESVNIEFENDFDLAEVRAILEKEEGVIVQDDPKNFLYPMPITAHGKDEVFVGRIRRDESQKNTLNLWIVADNLRKGAATNAVQIAEYLAKHQLI